MGDRSPFSDMSGLHQLRLCENLLATGAQAKSERLGNVRRADVSIEIEIGNRSRDAKRAVVATGG